MKGPEAPHGDSPGNPFPSPAKLPALPGPGWGEREERKLSATSRQSPASALALNWSTDTQSWDLSQIAAVAEPEPALSCRARQLLKLWYKYVQPFVQCAAFNPQDAQ